MYPRNTILVSTLVLTVVASSFCASPLESYNIDPSSVTVSGISSGAAFATQYHVIHSSSVKGAGMFAGVVYHCANSVAATALLCMGSPGLTDVSDLIDKTIDLAGKGDIDSTTGMSGDKVFVFAGSKDTVVDPLNGNQLVEFYNSFDSSIKSEFSVAAEHCQPTDDYGPSCDYLGGEYINDCSYDGAFEAMNYMYDGALTQPDGSVTANGQFLEFDQKEFYPLSSPGTYSADSSGYIYVPSGCVDKSNTCKLHLAFHGCQQGKEVVGDSFAKNTGYIEVAEANNIIVLFPQVVKNLLLNPQGCWDWWGYTGVSIYATKSGIQVKATEEMITRLISG